MERQFNISVGRSRHDVQWMGRAVSWAELVGYLKSCRRTSETFEEYRAMSKADQAAVKDVGGFVGGTLKGERRRASEVVSRSLVTLDIDFGQGTTPERVAEVLAGVSRVLYSTHSHSPETPRYRLVVPLSRDVTPEEYVPIARRVAQLIGIELFDASTYEPSRLMYWPSASSDAAVVCETFTGKALDADKVLASYADWRDVRSWPVATGETRVKHASRGAAQDPTEKGGIIGAWCRTYSVTEVIEAYLGDVYGPTAFEDRYTYVQGSTAGGLIVYEDKWAFSHHGTDPAGGRLCNAFDLVRLHKFSGLDDGVDLELTPVNRVPSFKAMSELALQDPKVKTRFIQEQQGGKGASEDYADLLGEDEAGEDWKAELRIDKRGQIVPTMYNYDLIIAHDPGLAGAFRYNAFEDRTEILRDLPWRKVGTDREWTSADDAGLLSHFSTHYNNLAGKQGILDSFELAKARCQYHPVRDYLDALPAWDGVERLDSLLIDYLGAEDNELTKAMTRKQFVAAVARIYRPGVKYDYVLTLVGVEALGKSSLIRIMGGDWFSDSLGTIEGKEGMEAIRGSWLIECSELTNYKRSTSETYKAFISKQSDKFRPAYARRAVNLRRQCVFFATTNEATFLKGDTGNRRFWPVEVGLKPHLDVNECLPAVREQLWAEAVHRYKQGEKLYLSGALEAEARKRQQGHNEIQDDSRPEMIRAFLDLPVPADWYSWDATARRDYFRVGRKDFEKEAGLTTIRRNTISAVEVLNELYGQALDDKNRYRTKDINNILRNQLGLEEIGSKRDTAYGKQRVFRVKGDEVEQSAEQGVEQGGTINSIVPLILEQ